MKQNCKIGRTFNESGRQLTNSEVLDIVSVIVDEVLTEQQRNEFVKETVKTLSKVTKGNRDLRNKKLELLSAD
jgi:hypothetical protein